MYSFTVRTVLAAVWLLSAPVLPFQHASAQASKLDIPMLFPIGGARLEQITFTADYSGIVECSEYGQIIMDVWAHPLELRYLQVGARRELRSKGDVVTKDTWIVRNMPVMPASEHIDIEIVQLELVGTGTPINLSDLDVTRGECITGETILIDAFFTPVPLNLDPFFFPFLPTVVEEVENNAEGDVGPGPLAPSSLPAAVTPALDFILELNYKYAGRKGMTNVEQGANECGPGGVANSMQWLKAKGAIDIGMETPAQTLEKLKADMQPGGWSGNGVGQKETVEGKLRYAAEAGLDLDVHYQADSTITDLGAEVEITVDDTEHTADRDGAGGKPTFAYLLKEMLKGQDVELSIDWLDAAGNKTGGHVIAVSGVFEWGSFRGIFFNDDSTQGANGGLRTNHWARITQDNGYMRLNGIGRNRVKAVYAESPKPKKPKFFSGSWFDSLFSGQGWLIESVAENLAVVYWFSYPPFFTDFNDKGVSPEQSWIVGVGEITGESIIVEDAMMSSGGMFGPDFNPDTVQLTTIGSMVFRREHCDTGIMSYGFVDRGAGSMRMERITNLDGLEDCGADEKRLMQPLNKTGIDGSFSGSWFDPTHSGEGWLIEILPGNLAVVYWFTYDSNGNQAWFVGVGTISGKTITIDEVFQGVGTFFGAGFDPGDVSLVPWGSMTFTFESCNSGTMTYASVLPEFGSGNLALQRITNVEGLQCGG